MSRSNPAAHAPNPARRWFEWNGEHGRIRYYDKEANANVDVPLPFTFLLLDELASVRGWHEASKSGIYSNEVRDTRTDLMVVKSFKGGLLAEGLYKEIKDRVNRLGGAFVANCYIAYKHEGALAIGSLRFKGSALGAWMEFRKEHRRALFEQAVDVVNFTEGKKGRITYRMPVFALKACSPETQDRAKALDVQLQGWLTDYFKRRTSDRTEAPSEAGEPEYPETELPEEGPTTGSEPLTDDDIPF